ncbi:CD63 antigen [Orchesella cincta]|uniref:Tetraspanin n=1 Tax=Orchesella cincta TaxID=48709 RepID=A0A1D2MGC8_ORCCI|nr:CD63 antigen [Orchesella cincta]
MPTDTDKGSFVGCNVLFAALPGITFVWAGLSGENGLSKYFSGILHGEQSGSAMFSTVLFVVTGILMIATAVLGCYGASTDNRCMLISYAMLMGLTLIVQLAAVTVLIKYDVSGVVRGGMITSMDNYYNSEAPTHNESVQFWNYLQSNLKCCGVHNYTEWKTASQAPTVGFIPGSCCEGNHDDFKNCSQAITNDNIKDVEIVSKIIYMNGCLDEYFRYYSMDLLAFCAILLATVQAFGLVYACYMAVNMRSGYLNLEYLSDIFI